MKFVTYSNFGGTPLLDLCHESFKRSLPGETLVVYCFDRATVDHCLKGGMVPVLWADWEPGEYHRWAEDPSSVYQKLTRQKYMMFKHALAGGTQALCFDADVVHLEDVRPHLLSLPEGLHCSVVISGSFNTGMQYFNNVPAHYFDMLIEGMRYDESALNSDHNAKKLHAHTLDKVVFSNPRYGEVPEGCAMLHYPGSGDLASKKGMLERAYRKHVASKLTP